MYLDNSWAVQSSPVQRCCLLVQFMVQYQLIMESEGDTPQVYAVIKVPVVYSLIRMTLIFLPS